MGTIWSSPLWVASIVWCPNVVREKDVRTHKHFFVLSLHNVQYILGHGISQTRRLVRAQAPGSLIPARQIRLAGLDDVM